MPAGVVKMAVIYTLGLGNDQVTDIIRLALRHGITIINDIRRVAMSKDPVTEELRHTQQEVRSACLAADIVYSRLADLAPTKKLHERFKRRPKTKATWREYEPLYVDYLRTLAPVIAMSSLEHQVGKNKHTVALLCSEKRADRCHRRLAAECVARKNGWSVHHLVVGDETVREAVQATLW